MTSDDRCPLGSAKDIGGRYAAEYIRMSTDCQDLSPGMQRAAISEYAITHGLSIVRTYFDPGKSGLTLAKRPAMKRLLADMTTSDRPYSVVLVYDISRWGRFQDTDASAYYEYHCRLHGVDVRYVQEPFAAVDSPLGALFKSLKRTMAAEYSRELSVKTSAGQTAAVSRGFQLGTLPCMGISRRAVSKADGSERALGPHDHKAARAEHMRWVLGPDHEVAAVRRIFHLYANTQLSVVDVARRARDEGIRARNGKLVTEWMLYRMLRCESFMGDFAWGREENKKRRAPADPRIRRMTGVMQPIIERAIFDKVQAKLASREHVGLTKDDVLNRLRRALASNPRLMATELRANDCACRETYRKYFGSLEAAWGAAGFKPHVPDAQDYVSTAANLAIGAAFCRNIFSLLTQAGVVCAYHRRPDRSSQTLLVNGQMILRTQVIWRRPRHGSQQWCLRKIYKGWFDWALVARLNEDGSAFDSFLVNRSDYFALTRWLPDIYAEEWQIHSNLLDVVSLFRGLRNPSA